MAAITSAQSGNWSATATWVGGVVPDPVLDIAIIGAGHTVTLNDSRTIPPTTIESLGGLVQGTGVTTTLGGTLTVGNGAAKDGTFTFGAGSTLAMGANNIVLNNCKLRSNSLSGAWAVVTGTAAIVMGAAHTAPKQDVVFAYVSFQNTGAITFAAAGTSGTGLTNQIDILNNVFVGTGTITLGLAGWTPLATTIKCNYSDFRSIGGAGILITGVAGTAVTQFIHNTGYNTSVADFRINGRNGATVEDSIFDGIVLGITSSITSGSHGIKRNFWTRPTASSNGSKVAIFVENKPANTFEDNYVFADWANPHPLGVSGTGGSGTQQINNNVFEDIYSADGANAITPGVLALNATGNLQIGAGELVACVSAITGAGITIKNNTAVVTSNLSDVNGHIFLLETAGVYTGTVKVSSNLMAYKNGITKGLTSRFCSNITATIPQTIAYGDYNAYPADLTAAYSNITATATGHDINDAPTFVDDTRNFASWGATVGADGTANGLKTLLAAINGYNVSTKTQSDTPPVGVSVAALTAWVRAGYAPTNVTLKGAGEGGVDIGAVLVSVESFTATYAAIQAAQSQSVAASLEFTGYSIQSQSVQSQIISALLQFSGDTAQQQAANTQALAAALSFGGAINRVQARQAETLAALLSFGGNISQAQAIQIETLAAILAFGGDVNQTQAQQAQAISVFVAALTAGGAATLFSQTVMPSPMFSTAAVPAAIYSTAATSFAPVAHDFGSWLWPDGVFFMWPDGEYMGVLNG